MQPGDPMRPGQQWVDPAITSFDPDQNLRMLEQTSVEC
jgi:hypothetical protein